MRRKRTLILAALLTLASLAMAQQPPSKEPAAKKEQTPSQEEAGGPVLSEEISDQAVWSKEATSKEADAGFVPSEAISADATIAFPVDI